MNFLGNEKAKETLFSMQKSGRLSHAFLLCGEQGVGKKTFARLMAQTILCERNDAPCGECDSCKKVALGVHPDVEEITEYTRPASFSVERVREVRSRAYISPNEGKKRVFILANADCMSVGAQNALLKIIEEPPETAVFILTAQNREKMLTTVLSRCVSVPLVPVSPDEAKKRVAELSPDTDEKTLNSVAAVFGGNIGQVLEAVKDPKALDNIKNAFSLLKALAKSDRYHTLAVLSKAQNAVSATALLQNSAAILQRSIQGTENPILDKTPLEARVFWLSEMIQALGNISKNANISLLMTHLCVKLYSYSF